MLQMEDIMDTKNYDKTMHNMIQLIAKDKMDTYPVLCGSGHVLIKWERIVSTLDESMQVHARTKPEKVYYLFRDRFARISRMQLHK
jgi:hypothetical protein